MIRLAALLAIVAFPASAQVYVDTSRSATPQYNVDASTGLPVPSGTATNPSYITGNQGAVLSITPLGANGFYNSPDIVTPVWANTLVVRAGSNVTGTVNIYQKVLNVNYIVASIALTRPSALQTMYSADLVIPVAGGNVATYTLQIVNGSTADSQLNFSYAFLSGSASPLVSGGTRPSIASNGDSGTIATSGGTAAVSLTSSSRAEVINPSTATLWASFGTPTVNGVGSFAIAPNGSYSTDRALGTLTLLSTAANQPYTVNRFAY